MEVIFATSLQQRPRQLWSWYIILLNLTSWMLKNLLCSEPVYISSISILGDHTVTVARHGRQVFREEMKNYQKPLVMHQSRGWERGRRRRNFQYRRRKSKEYLVMFICNGPAETRGGRLTLSSRGEMLFPCAEQIQLLNIINWFLIGLRELGWISDGGSLRMKIEMGPRHKLDKSFQCLQWAEIKTKQIFLVMTIV